jgi:hypothetical protein
MQSEEVIKKAGEKLMQGFDETLLVLGQSVREEIFNILERVHFVKFNKFPINWKAISSSFHQIFGLGAQNFESFIVKQMANKLEIKVAENTDFESAMQRMDFQLRKRIGSVIDR